MADLPQVPGAPDEQSNGGGVPNVNRRRLLKAGLAGAPVLMTVVSKPVLATGNPGQCTTPSGFTSINASTPGNDSCSGCTPHYWKQSSCFSQWPSGCYPVDSYGKKATKFSECFSNGTVYSGKTLLDVLNKTGGPPDDVGRHCVAAYLNVRSGRVPSSCLTVVSVRDIWSEYITKGYYSPNAGVQWNNTDIVTYLLTTMPV